MPITTTIMRGFNEGNYDNFFYDYRVAISEPTPPNKSRGFTQQPNRRVPVPGRM